MLDFVVQKSPLERVGGNSVKCTASSFTIARRDWTGLSISCARLLAELYNCVCCCPSFLLHGRFHSPHFSARLHITTGLSYWFTTLFSHTFRFTVFPISNAVSSRSAALLYVKSSTQNISWWWNINRSKEFNYINSLFFVCFPSPCFLRLLRFPISFFISNQFRDSGNSFVKLHFRNWRRAKAENEKSKALTVKRFWFDIALPTCVWGERERAPCRSICAPRDCCVM